MEKELIRNAEGSVPPVSDFPILGQTIGVHSTLLSPVFATLDSLLGFQCQLILLCLIEELCDLLQKGRNAAVDQGLFFL